MIKRAMPISTSAKAIIAGLGLSLALTAPAAAQVVNQEPDAMDVARTPLEDFNIDSDDLPEVLVAAANDPYATDGLETCNDIVAQIAPLDQVLGSDFDIADDVDGRGISEGKIAQSIVGSFIPFRGIVREVTGANSRRKQFELAVTAGMVRRAFLKGLGLRGDCSYPARPREERGSMTGAK